MEWKLLRFGLKKRHNYYFCQKVQGSIYIAHKYLNYRSPFICEINFLIRFIFQNKVLKVKFKTSKRTFKCMHTSRIWNRIKMKTREKETYSTSIFTCKHMRIEQLKY